MSATPPLVFVTDVGSFSISVDPTAAPVTARNFVELVRDGAYDAGVFHRTVRLDNGANSQMAASVVGRGISGESAQYRLPDDRFPICVVQASAREAPAHRRPIPLERTRDTGLRHVRGAVSMSRQAADTAVSDFFICLRDEPELDFGGRRNPDGQGSAVFGRVSAGIETVQRIHESPSRGQTLDPSISIVRAYIERKPRAGIETEM